MTHFSWAIDGSIVGLYLVATMVAGMMVRRTWARWSTSSWPAGRSTSSWASPRWPPPSSASSPACIRPRPATNTASPARTPGILAALAMLFVGITGFCINPLRKAGVMTIPEMFEKRYGPAHSLGGRRGDRAWRAVEHGGLPPHHRRVPGAGLRLRLDHLNRNVVLTMTVLLLLGTIYTVVGGMLSVLVTDFLQFIVMSAGLIAVTVLILTQNRLGPPGATVSAALWGRRLQAVGQRPTTTRMAVRALQRLDELAACDVADHDLASWPPRTRRRAGRSTPAPASFSSAAG